MNCIQALENLSAYYDGELPEALHSDMEHHLSSCTNCRCELQSFQCLSVAIDESPGVSQSTTQLVQATWEKLTSRMDERIVSDQVSSPHTELPRVATRVGTSRPAWVGWGLAVAATLLLIATWRSVDKPTTTSEIAIDFSEVIKHFAQEPKLAMESLTKQYAGQEIEVQQAEKLLGYRPALAGHLPNNVRLVSTRLLKLPECICQNGKCMCTINGCNCAATLCSRADGSEFLVLEHCESERVGFKDIDKQEVTEGDRELQLLGTGQLRTGQLRTASWTHQSHRLTAIGLTSISEALALAEVTSRP